MRYLLVDAHSMIFAWADLRALHDRRMESARDELVRRMTAYQDATGERVVLVFDGQGARTQSRLEPDGIQIIYSRSGQTADSVIERLAANYAERHEIRVATSDRLEQLTVSAFGATTLGADQLADEVGRAAADLARRIRGRNRGR